MQQYADIYLLQKYSTCFGCPSDPSSGVRKTVTAASGTDHFTYPGNNLPPAFVTRILEMTCTTGCSYSFM